MKHRILHLLAVSALAGAAACAPPPPAAAPAPVTGLPPIPAVDGPLEIRVVHPTPQTPRPNADSTLVYGSVGTGRASLTINGSRVGVEPNGAFLAFLPVPEDGTYRLEATARGRTERTEVSYRTPAPAAPGAAPARAPETVDFPTPREARVVGGGDTLATGSDVAIGRPSPTGTYRWFLPRGARLTVTGQRGSLLRARLADGTEAWFADTLLAVGGEDARTPEPVGNEVLRSAPQHLDVRVPVRGAPFLVEQTGGDAVVTLYGVEPPTAPVFAGGDPLVRTLRWSRAAPGVSRLSVALTEPLWGYKAFYEEDGTLVLRLRRPPEVIPTDPFNGIRVLVDPGHPPAGATGPTGLREADANLAIALRLAELLRQRGAEVVMTRTDDEPLVSRTSAAAELGARVELAVRSDAHLLVSVHNNAFAEGVNPFRSHGTETYHFHPHAEDLARALHREILAVTRIPDRRVRTANLALARPTWMPAVLTESVFMPVPEQEAALRHPGFLDALAEAHLRGIEGFLRGRAGGGGR